MCISTCIHVHKESGEKSSWLFNARRMRTRGNYSTLSVCLSVTSLLVSFHVYTTNYTYLPVLR